MNDPSDNRTLVAENQSWRISEIGAGVRMNLTAADWENIRQMDMLRKTYAWLIPCMWAILSLAVVGNGLILCAAKWLRKPVTPNLRLCVSLAAADVWAAALMMSGLLVNSYLPTVLLVRKVEWLRCAMLSLETVRLSGMLTSDLHLFALAINHYLGITTPLKYKVIVTTRRLRIAIAVMWILPLLVLFGWFCVIPGEGFLVPTCPHQFYFRLPFRLTVFIVFVVPLIATLSIYMIILKYLFQAKARSRDVDLRRSIKRCTSNNRLQRKFKVVWTTLLIVGTFTLSWGLCLLYFILVCLDGCVFIHGKSLSIPHGLTISAVVNALVMAKLAGNPLVYALRIPHFRFALMRMLVACNCLAKTEDRRPIPALLTNLSFLEDTSGIMQKRASIYLTIADQPRSRSGSSLLLMQMDAFRSRDCTNNNSASTGAVDQLSVGWQGNDIQLRVRPESENENRRLISTDFPAHRLLRRCSSDEM
uniref:G-protein coupled receptors family 1 profile domain-containing protein n=1 Tax=Plectus sambesii TaxID=2011161 RepID=A0A914V480_9BILA